MEENREITRLRYRGRVKQIPIYLGKLFRMFIYLDDWKVLPMAAIIAGMVSFVAGENMFKTMEGTALGSLALTCICIWNGFFNSIQSVCRERDIVKREHRSGMHISSYVFSHVVYQALLCAMQAVITVIVCYVTKMEIPKQGLIFPSFTVDFTITMFLITFSADMMSLMISCIARNTTAAMTVMPFTLIFELLFSGSMFGLGGRLKGLTDLSIAKWGITCVSSLSDYNSLPMVTVWNQIVKFSDVEVLGVKPIKAVVDVINQNGLVNDFCLLVGKQTPNADYIHSIGNILNCWSCLIMFALLFAVIAVIALERIDKDKR